jgi:uncharacterized protein YkwD
MKSRKLLVFLFCLIFVFYSCKKDASNLTGIAKTPTSSSGKDSSEQLMLKLVNNVRTSGCTCGTTLMPPVDSLTWNSLLAEAALSHSEDMNTNNYFSHTGLNGSTPGERITATGYVWSSYGENIAEGYSDVQSVMNAWLQSEGHCDNIMNAGFKEMGAGNSGLYWTQDFGSRQ